MKRTKEKGITLIALIITIIVMLILVGVTVNVALNGGLFSTAKDAVNETQIELDRDLLFSAVVGAIGNNGEVDFSVLDRNLPEGFTGSNGTYTSKSGNKFKVDKNGTITYIEEGSEPELPETEDEGLALLKKYFLGDNGEGKDFMSLIDFGENDKMFFIDDPDTTENERELLEDLTNGLQDTKQISDDHMAIYVKCNKKAYKVAIKIENSTYIPDNVDLIYKPKDREGDLVEYDSNNDGIKENWRILYNNGSNLEIISEDVMGSLTLGKGDKEAQGESNLDKAIYSYNHAIGRLNSYCGSLITNTNSGVRSIGSNPSNPESENSEFYSSENITKWNSAYNGIGKSTDTNSEQDVVRMLYHGIKSKDTSYWLASRTVDSYASTSSVYFRVDYVLAENDYNHAGLWIVRDNGYVGAVNEGSTISYGVRPVVKVSSDQI